MTLEMIVAFFSERMREIVEFISRNPLVLIGFIILALGSRPRKDEGGFANLRIVLATYPLDALKIIFQQIGKTLNTDSPEDNTLFAAPEKIIGVIAETNQKVKKVLDNNITALNTHIKITMNVIESDENMQPWRVAGAVLTAILLILFIYADISQSVNNLALLPVGPIDVSPWLTNLTLSIVVSSIGTVFALVLIIIDTIGVTHFIPWERSIVTHISDKETPAIAMPRRN